MEETEMTNEPLDEDEMEFFLAEALKEVETCKTCGQPTCGRNDAEKYFPVKRKGQSAEQDKSDDR
jgi:hypothetical protein